MTRAWVSKPRSIELLEGIRIPILHEHRVVPAIDKPAGWMLAPDSWDNTARNLQRALVSSLRAFLPAYPDPFFQQRLITIHAPVAEFCRPCGFEPPAAPVAASPGARAAAS